MAKKKLENFTFTATLAKNLFYDPLFKKHYTSYVPLAYQAMGLLARKQLSLGAYRVAIQMLLDAHSERSHLLARCRSDYSFMRISVQGVLEELLQSGILTKLDISYKQEERMKNKLNSGTDVINSGPINTGPLMDSSSGRPLDPAEASRIEKNIQLALINYPNNFDKPLGLEIIREQLKTLEDSELFLRACKNYAKHIKGTRLADNAFKQIRWACFCQETDDNWKSFIDGQPEGMLFDSH